MTRKIFVCVFIITLAFAGVSFAEIISGPGVAVVETEAGNLISSADFSQLQSSLGIKVTIDKKKAEKNKRENFINIIKKSIDEFEKNRQKYIDLMDPDLLEEEGEDLMAFKAKTLKNECPIIHNTLFTERDEFKHMAHVMLSILSQ